MMEPSGRQKLFQLLNRAKAQLEAETEVERAETSSTISDDAAPATEVSLNFILKCELQSLVQSVCTSN